MTRNELAWAIRRKIAIKERKNVNEVSWKYCYGVAGQRMKQPQPKPAGKQKQQQLKLF